MRYVITVRHGGATITTITTVDDRTTTTATQWNDPITWAGPPVIIEPRQVVRRAPFFPAASRATMAPKRPKQAPPRAAYVRAYQRRREPRTRAEK